MNLTIFFILALIAFVTGHFILGIILMFFAIYVNV